MPSLFPVPALSSRGPRDGGDRGAGVFSSTGKVTGVLNTPHSVLSQENAVSAKIKSALSPKCQEQMSHPAHRFIKVHARVWRGYVPLPYRSLAPWNNQKKWPMSFIRVDNFLMSARQLIYKPAHALLAVLHIHIHIPGPSLPRLASADLLGSVAQGSTLSTNSPGAHSSPRMPRLAQQKHSALPSNPLPSVPTSLHHLLGIYTHNDLDTDLAYNRRYSFKIHYYMLW